MFSKQDIEKYFLAEKQLGLSFIVIGAVAIVLAIVFFFFLKTNFYKGAAIPLAIVGIIHLLASFSIYKKSDEDRVKNVYAYDMNPSQLKDVELPRMKKVLKNFAIIKWVEMALVIVGLALIAYYRNDADKALWYGLGHYTFGYGAYYAAGRLQRRKKGPTVYKRNGAISGEK